MTAPRRWLVSLALPSWMFLSVLSVLHVVSLPVTLAAHARKRPTVASASQRRSASNPYDKQITTFDTDGHIMQLQYAQKAVSKGSSALFMHYKDQIIAVLQTNHGTSPQNKSDYKNKSLHRIHHGMFAKMTGLQGDSRLLAKYLLQKSLEFDWKEGQLNSNQPLSPLTSLRIQQIANACGEVQHSLTTKPGARPLAVDAVLFGIDGVVDMRETNESASATGSDNGIDIDSDSDSIHQMTYRHKLGLYKCHLTGVVDQCQYCIVGNIASNRMLYDECKQQMEDLLHVNTKGNEDEIASTTDADADPQRLLIINSMAKLLLKHQLQRQELIDDISGTHGKGKGGDDNKSNLSITDDAHSKDSPAVDIYILTPDPKCRGGIQITCATCVKEDNIEHVGQLLQSTSQR
mmetsp:Transcript_2394/g.3687  ORF Transcript_2394/g.3687 Transcript_2394/m.3687 type:complete len:404 (+) Transcript_2394:75-1286(+)